MTDTFEVDTTLKEENVRKVNSNGLKRATEKISVNEK